MTVLNLASNRLGELVLPEGWTKTGGGFSAPYVFKHADGREQKEDPSKPEGIIAIANAIPDMGAMTSLNLASNYICLYGNMDGIKAISSAVKVLAIILIPLLSLSDLSFNCWCLLLSPGYGGDDEPGY
jgi:hypothetical protein